MKLFELLQAVLATLAFLTAAATTGAMIYRGDALVGIIGYAFITTLLGAMTYKSYTELRSEKGGSDDQL